MSSGTVQPNPPRPEDVRFQLSLLRLLYSSAASATQQTELEQLLKPPAKLVTAH